MLCEFKAITEAVGLGIHPDKTKILSNQYKEYLGQKNHVRGARNLGDQKQAESSVGSVPQIYRQELTSKDYRLCHRLRLFGMVITPTLTYASGTWMDTLTKKNTKNDQDCATKHASPYRTDKNKIQTEKRCS